MEDDQMESRSCTFNELAFEVEYWLEQLLWNINHWKQHRYAELYNQSARHGFLITSGPKWEALWWEETILANIQKAWRVLQNLPQSLREVGADPGAKANYGRRGSTKAEEVAWMLETTFTQWLNIVHLFHGSGGLHWFELDHLLNRGLLQPGNSFERFWRVMTGIPDQLRSLANPTGVGTGSWRGVPADWSEEFDDFDIVSATAADLKVSFDDHHDVGEPGELPHIAHMEVESKVVCLTLSAWPDENYVLHRSWGPLRIDLQTPDWDEAVETATELFRVPGLLPHREDGVRSLSAAALRFFPEPNPAVVYRIRG